AYPDRLEAVALVEALGTGVVDSYLQHDLRALERGGRAQQLTQQPGAEAGAPVVAGGRDGLDVRGPGDRPESGVADQTPGLVLGDHIVPGRGRVAGVGELRPEHSARPRVLGEELLFERVHGVEVPPAHLAESDRRRGRHGGRTALYPAGTW